MSEATHGKSSVEVAKLNSNHLVRRIHKETGEELVGALVWTQLTDSINPELVYIPEASELISAPEELVSVQTKMPCKQMLLKESEPIGKELFAAPKPLREVGRYYTGGCDGGDSYDNNCAHFLSNAFIRAGHSELLTSGVISQRCRSGAKRAIRAYDMLRWFQAKSVRFRSGVIPQGNGVWATYQEKPGWKHVLISDTDAWEYYGTGDYPDWPIQYNYQW